MDFRAFIVSVAAVSCVATAVLPSIADDGQSAVDSSIVERALIGIQFSLNDRFRTADSIFAGIASEFVTSPIGPLFAAGNVQAEMLDTESLARLRDFEQYINEAESRARRSDSLRFSRAEVEFALGVAAGYRAVYESKWGGMFAALKQGLRAKRHFQQALELDSSLCDANLGLGTYYYWKSAKTDWINWLPIVADERERGLALLERTIGCGQYARETARAALAGALITEGRFAVAIAHAETLATMFPNAKGPLWLKAKAHYAMYEWDEAAGLFDSLEARIRENGAGNYFNLIECAYYRAQCHWGAGKYRDALSECGKAITYPADQETKKRQHEHLDDLRRMQRKLVKMLDM
jgi:tetratricopeptide (TPR) repeat protein